MRPIASTIPTSMPRVSIASMAYCEQVGTNRQVGVRFIGERNRRYQRIGATIIDEGVMGSCGRQSRSDDRASYVVLNLAKVNREVIAMAKCCGAIFGDEYDISRGGDPPVSS